VPPNLPYISSTRSATTQVGDDTGLSNVFDLASAADALALEPCVASDAGGTRDGVAHLADAVVVEP
jgi:hypothetical protein